MYLDVALVIPQLATATVPMPAQHLGQVEGILDYCGKVNPGAASTYKELKKLMDGDASANDLAEAAPSRNTRAGTRTPQISLPSCQTMAWSSNAPLISKLPSSVQTNNGVAICSRNQ